MTWNPDAPLGDLLADLTARLTALYATVTLTPAQAEAFGNLYDDLEHVRRRLELPPWGHDEQGAGE